MKSTINLALIQFESILGDPAASRAKAEIMIREAAENGAELICLPELYTTGYNLDLVGPKMADMAEAIDGPTITNLQKLAKELKVHIIAPLALQLEDDPEARPFNSAVFIDDKGEILGVYSKCHLFETERMYFQPGQELPVFDTKFGKIGIMICFDAGFPEVARILQLKGAELILCPSAWRIQDMGVWHLNMPQRAQENSCYVAAVNRYGREGSLYMGGYSIVCGPEGDIIKEITEEKENILYCTISGQRLADFRADGGPYIPYRRPKLYEREGLLD